MNPFKLLSGLSAHCGMDGWFGCVRVAFCCTLPGMVIWETRDPCKVQLFDERLPMHLFTPGILACLDVEGIFLCRTVVVRKNCKKRHCRSTSHNEPLCCMFSLKKEIDTTKSAAFLSWGNCCRLCWWFEERVSIQLDWIIAHYEASYFRKSLKRWMLTHIKCKWKVIQIRHSFDLSPSTCVFTYSRLFLAKGGKTQTQTSCWPKVILRNGAVWCFKLKSI